MMGHIERMLMSYFTGLKFFFFSFNAACLTIYIYDIYLMLYALQRGDDDVSAGHFLFTVRTTRSNNNNSGVTE